MPKAIAQFNMAKARFPSDSDGLADFMNNLEAVNAVADRSKGFVWRLKADTPGDAITDQIFEDSDLLLNMSVWETIEDFRNFVFQTVHGKFLARRAEWFFPAEQPSFVMWWVDLVHKPTLEEAHEMLNVLGRDGPTANAFTLSAAFDAEGNALGSLV